MSETSGSTQGCVSSILPILHARFDRREMDTDSRPFCDLRLAVGRILRTYFSIPPPDGDGIPFSPGEVAVWEGLEHVLKICQVRPVPHPPACSLLISVAHLFLLASMCRCRNGTPPTSTRTMNPISSAHPSPPPPLTTLHQHHDANWKQNQNRPHHHQRIYQKGSKYLSPSPSSIANPFSSDVPSVSPTHHSLRPCPLSLSLSPTSHSHSHSPS